LPLKHHAPFDVARYYESIDHEILLEILRQRGASAASACAVYAGSPAAAAGGARFAYTSIGKEEAPGYHGVNRGLPVVVMVVGRYDAQAGAWQT